MQKALLMSILVATFTVPSAVRRSRPSTHEFRLVLTAFAGITAVYVMSLLYLYPRLK